jgi:hypothetical protein
MKISPITYCKIIWKALKILFSKDKRQAMAKPKTLEQACSNLASTFEMLPDNAKDAAMQSNSPHEFAAKFHFAGGRNLRNNWELWNPKGDLHKHLKERFGLHHADDMSGLIFKCTFQLIKGIEPTPDKFAEEFIAYWKAYEEGGESQISDYVINFETSDIKTVKAKHPHKENIFCKNCCVKIGERDIRSTIDVKNLPIFCDKCLEEMKEKGDEI